VPTLGLCAFLFLVSLAVPCLPHNANMVGLWVITVCVTVSGHWLAYLIDEKFREGPESKVDFLLLYQIVTAVYVAVSLLPLSSVICRAFCINGGDFKAGWPNLKAECIEY
jgi:hypothetical protein